MDLKSCSAKVRTGCYSSNLRGEHREASLRAMEARVERQLGLPEVDREGTLEKLSSDLASFTADALSGNRWNEE